MAAFPSTFCGGNTVYEFIDDSPLSDEELLAPVVAVKPLPAGLNDPSTWMIPHAERLDHLFSLMSPRTAFCLWASEVLFEADRRAEWADRIDHLAEARAEALGAMYDKYQPGDVAMAGDIVRRRRAAFQPFIEAGLTFRQVAVYLDIPLKHAVMCMLSPLLAKGCTAENYADVEDALIGGVLHTTPLKQVCRDSGISMHTLNILCNRHGIDHKAIAKERGRPSRRKGANTPESCVA
jgi:hypothetical protein